jgi:hypothetical protein
MDRIMQDYPGLFGLSGNVDDRRNPYGNVMAPQLAQTQAEVPMAPQYQTGQLNEFTPDMLPSSQMARASRGAMDTGGSVMPRNLRPDPQWFQPPLQPPPIQNMNYQGGPQQSGIPINLISALGGGY